MSFDANGDARVRGVFLVCLVLLTVIAGDALFSQSALAQHAPHSRPRTVPASRTPKVPPLSPAGDTQLIIINGVSFEVSSAYRFFTWRALPADISIQRQPVQTFRNASGESHSYEVVFVRSGNLNWYQAALLAQEAGGYLACITSAQENDFVFSLVNDPRYFWAFPPHSGNNAMNHHEISIGPFLGGYQPLGAPEPAGGWQWLSGEPWTYSNWAVDLNDGIIDKDPRDNTQPNNSGDSRFGQRVMGFGEMNQPVRTWGDYLDGVGTYGEVRPPGRSYAFIIEYENKAD